MAAGDLRYTGKLLLGFVTVLPLLIFGMFFAFIAFLLVFSPPNLDEGIISGVFNTQFIGAILSLPLLLLYVVHACKNRSLDQRQLIQWIVLLLVGGFLTMPIYWYWYIWKNNAVSDLREGVGHHS